MPKTKVLVVDDDIGLLKLVSGYLRQESQYDVITASSPVRALELIKSEPHIDLLISDVDMPGMRGPELLLQVKRVSPQTACILMSGYLEDPASIPPDVPFLQKPFDRTALISAVEKVLSAAK